MKRIMPLILLIMTFLLINTPATAGDQENKSLPWSSKQIKEFASKLDYVSYHRTGTEKDKKVAVDDAYSFVVEEVDQVGVRSSIQIDPSPATIFVGGVGGGFKDQISPFFPVMRPKVEILKKEKLKVTAGEFDCVVVRIKDIFDSPPQTAWMIIDQPGVYAKLEDQGLKYELLQVGKK